MAMKAFLVSTALLAALCFSATSPKKTVPTAKKAHATASPKKSFARLPDLKDPLQYIVIYDKFVDQIAVRIDGHVQFTLGEDNTIYTFDASDVGANNMLSILEEAKVGDYRVTVLHDSTTMDGYPVAQYIIMK